MVLNLLIFLQSFAVFPLRITASQSHGSTEDPYLFSNPVPPEMQPVPMADLAAVRVSTWDQGFDDDVCCQYFDDQGGAHDLHFDINDVNNNAMFTYQMLLSPGDISCHNLDDFKAVSIHH